MNKKQVHNLIELDEKKRQLEFMDSLEKQMTERYRYDQTTHNITVHLRTTGGLLYTKRYLRLDCVLEKKLFIDLAMYRIPWFKIERDTLNNTDH